MVVSVMDDVLLNVDIGEDGRCTWANCDDSLS
jgi:hypothetical protein